jgi:hypothetical protein
MDIFRKNQPNQLAEDLRFEYSHLNQEIDHNENRINEILGAALLLISALLSVAFSQYVSNRFLQFLLYFLVQAIACLGLRQTLERERGTFVIASYLRTFIEPELPGLKWETRLEKFRSRSQKTTRHTFYINYRLFTYPFLILLSFLLIAAHLYYYLQPTIIPTTAAIAVVVLDFVVMVCFVIGEWKFLNEVTINHAKSFDPLWLEIKQEESKGVKRS